MKGYKAKSLIIGDQTINKTMNLELGEFDKSIECNCELKGGDYYQCKKEYH